MTYDEIKACDPEEFAMRKLDKLGYRYPRGESYLDVLQRHAPPAPARAPRRCERRRFTEKRFRLKPDASGARRCGLVKEGRDASG